MQEEIKHKENTKGKGFRVMSDEELEKVTGGRGFWDDCPDDCSYYGHVSYCNDAQKRGTCPRLMYGKE